MDEANDGPTQVSYARTRLGDFYITFESDKCTGYVSVNVISSLTYLPPPPSCAGTSTVVVSAAKLLTLFGEADVSQASAASASRYQVGQDCQTLYQHNDLQRGYFVLDIVLMDLYTTATVAIYDGATTTAPVLATYSAATSAFPPLITSGAQFLVVFQGPTTGERLGAGYQILATPAVGPPPVPCQALQIVTGALGATYLLQDTSLPRFAPSVCGYRLQGPPGTQTVIEGGLLAIGVSVRIFDGASAAAAMILAQATSADAINVRSTAGSSLYLDFRFNTSRVYRDAGFSIPWTVATVPTYCSGVSTVSVLALATEFSMPSDRSDHMLTSWYPGGLDCTIVFVAPPMFTVQLAFNAGVDEPVTLLPEDRLQILDDTSLLYDSTASVDDTPTSVFTGTCGNLTLRFTSSNTSAVRGSTFSVGFSFTSMITDLFSSGMTHVNDNLQCRRLPWFSGLCPSGEITTNTTYLQYLNCTVIQGNLRLNGPLDFVFPNLLAVSGCLSSTNQVLSMLFPRLRAAGSLSIGELTVDGLGFTPSRPTSFGAASVAEGAAAWARSIAPRASNPGRLMRGFLDAPALEMVLYAVNLREACPGVNMPALVSSTNFAVVNSVTLSEVYLPSFSHGNIIANYPPALASIELPALQVCTGLMLTGVTALSQLTIPTDCAIECNFLVDQSALTSLTLAASVSGDITFSNNPTLTSISLLNTGAVGALLLQGNYFLQSLSLPTLQSAQIVLSSSRVARLSLPNFVSGVVRLADNSLLTAFEAPQLTLLDSLSVSRCGLLKLSLPSLVQVDSIDLSQNPSLSELTLCNLRSLNILNVSACPVLSCQDLSASLSGVTNRPTINAAAPDCDGTAVGVFGCQRNATQVVNTTACGFTVACIQSAIDHAFSDQDITVFVPAGVYTNCTAPLNTGGKSFFLKGAGIGNTTIDCGGSGRALIVDSLETSSLIISDMSFVGGAADTGGAVMIENASPRFERCLFRGVAFTSGGAVAVLTSAAPVFVDCIIRGASAASGGGLYVSATATSISWQGGAILNNDADGNGGGILVETSANSGPVVVFSNAVVAGNQATRGGGLYTSARVTLDHVTFTSNTAGDFGGGLAVVPTAELGVWCNLTAVNLTANVAGGGGGGLFGFSANLAIDGGVMDANQAGEEGGGGMSVTCSQNYRILSDVIAPCPLTIRVAGTNFTGNQASGGNGGAVLATDVALMLVGVSLTSNSAVGGSGGGVYVSVVDLSATDAMWTANGADVSGGGLYCEPFTGGCDIHTSVFQSNSAVVAGAGVYLCTTACPNGTTIDHALVTPNLHVDNSFQGNSLAEGGYGADYATDASSVTWIVPPADTILSGHSVAAAIVVHVTDGYAQAVTSSASLQTLSLCVLRSDGTSASDAVTLSGTQTVLAESGTATFTGITLAANNVSGLDQTYLLACSLSEIDGLLITSPVLISRCEEGQGRSDAAAPVDCQPCAAGTAGGAATEFVCLACPAGSYSAGAASCTLCPVNFYAPNSGASSCLACPGGYSAVQEGAVACLQDPAADAVTSTNLGVLLGSVLGAVFAVLLVVGLCLYRLARRRTMRKYYLDNDATIRTGTTESPLQKDVARILTASSTTRIGGGMYSNVYKAKYEGKWIALKVIKGEMATNGTAQQEFRREAIALSRLEERNHPSIIALMFFLNYNPMCIGVEFCGGGSLKRAILHQEITEGSMKTRLMAEAASALCVVHACNIVHLDIKTDNMLLTNSNHLILADFGIARVLAQTGLTVTTGSLMAPSEELYLPDEYHHHRSLDSTGSGGSAVNMRSIGGASNASGARSSVVLRTTTEAQDTAFTPQYVDPLRITNDMNLDEAYLPTADVFSFGIMMWAVFAEQEPYMGERPDELVERLREDPSLRPPMPIKGCPVFYDRLLQRCWHEVPSARPTFREILDTLKDGLLSEYGTTLEDAYANPQAQPYATSGVSAGGLMSRNSMFGLMPEGPGTDYLSSLQSMDAPPPPPPMESRVFDSYDLSNLQSVAPPPPPSSQGY